MLLFDFYRDVRASKRALINVAALRIAARRVARRFLSELPSKGSIKGERIGTISVNLQLLSGPVVLLLPRSLVFSLLPSLFLSERDAPREVVRFNG